MAKDKCQFCLGAKGGVLGNENVIGGVVICDYCTSLYMDARDSEAKKNLHRAPDTVLGEWVYCGQHLAPHSTGWCTVDLRWKVGLGLAGKATETYKEAFAKCERLGLKLHKDA